MVLFAKSFWLRLQPKTGENDFKALITLVFSCKRVVNGRVGFVNELCKRTGKDFEKYPLRVKFGQRDQIPFA